MRYDNLFRSDWARCFNDHREPLTYVGGSGVSGALNAIVFENYSESSDEEGGRSSTVSFSIVADRQAFESGFGRPRHGDTITLSGTTLKVVAIDADPSAYTIRAEAGIKQERTPGNARRAT